LLEVNQHSVSPIEEYKMIKEPITEKGVNLQEDEK